MRKLQPTAPYASTTATLDHDYYSLSYLINYLVIERDISCVIVATRANIHEQKRQVASE